MREILFTGKRVDNGEWVEGFYVFVPEHYKPEMSRKSYIVSINNGLFFEVIPETVGQYIGLTDKNGTKIFEGGVVKCKHEIRHSVDKEDKIPRFVYGVEHEERQGCFVTESTIYYRNYEIQFYKGRYRIINKNIIHYIDRDYIYNHEIEVIGNIHDNPELLEAEK